MMEARISQIPITRPCLITLNGMTGLESLVIPVLVRGIR